VPVSHFFRAANYCLLVLVRKGIPALEHLLDSPDWLMKGSRRTIAKEEVNKVVDERRIYWLFKPWIRW
jgi:hypothetical protein